MAQNVLLQQMQGSYMETTEQVRHLGLYSSYCCVQELLFDVDDHFPRCPKCERFCRWKLVERVVAWYELEDDLQLRAA